jgi:hypothetical protein
MAGSVVEYDVLQPVLSGYAIWLVFYAGYACWQCCICRVALLNMLVGSDVYVGWLCCLAMLTISYMLDRYTDWMAMLATPTAWLF